MTSILTNVAAMSALQTLRSINNSLEDTQARVSSGFRVAEAKDNAAYWSIATTMRSDNKALSAVSDALGLGAAKVDTAYSAMSNSIDIVSEIKAKIVAATENGVDKTKLQDEISQLQQQLKSVAQSATFSGENWVVGSGTRSVVSSFIRDANGQVSVQTTNYDLDDTTTGNVLFGITTAGAIDMSKGIIGTPNGTYGSIANMNISTFGVNELNVALKQVEAAIQGLTKAGSQLGSISTRIDLQESFVSKLSDSIDKGVGRLVDANMEEESSKLTAFKTQQQLAIQSLSIANSSAQNVLTLFKS
jgi:flagellin